MLAQEPVPLPLIDLEKFERTWWVVTLFDKTIANDPNDIFSCYRLKIKIEGDKAHIKVSGMFKNQIEGSEVTAEITSKNSVWKI